MPSLAMATDVEATVAMDVADTARGRLMPSLAMATDVEAMVAMDVADTARGRLMLSLRPMLLSSMEATTATLLPLLMQLPTLTPMAMLLLRHRWLLPLLEEGGRGRARLWPQRWLWWLRTWRIWLRQEGGRARLWLWSQGWLWRLRTWLRQEGG